MPVSCRNLQGKPKRAHSKSQYWWCVLHSRPHGTPDEWYIATLLAVAGERNSAKIAVSAKGVNTCQLDSRHPAPESFRVRRGIDVQLLGHAV